MSTTCKYCNNPEDKQHHPGLICESCICFVHVKCLRRAGTPGDLSGDVFFDYTCEDCSPEKEEIFIRMKILWVHALLLTLYHLSNHMSGMSKQGYFHYKTHICSFIDRTWLQLFGSKFKQKKNWIGTIAGALSVYSNLLFQSGLAPLGESGWWKLRHNFSPAVAAHIIQEISREKIKSRSRNNQGMDMVLFIAKVTELGYKDQLVEEEVIASPNHTPAKKRRLEFEEFNPTDLQDYVVEEKLSPIKQDADDYFDASTASVSSRDNFSDVDNLLRDRFDYTTSMPLTQFQSDSSSVHSYKYSYNCDSDSSLREQASDTEFKKDKTKRNEEIPYTRRETLFSKQMNSVEMPWLTPVEVTKDAVDITEYEEIQLLKTVESLVHKVRNSEQKTYLAQIKSKLALRRLKRHKHLPVFNLDKTVKILGGYVAEEKKTIANVERVLDRFQRSYLIDNLSGTISNTNYGTVLVSSIEPAPFRSAYSGASLKPYIRRDRETNPTWLKLMDELLMKTHKHEKDYSPPPRGTIDYSYVRPHHIAAVNRLCAMYFWPGIDLTEALQYPEFSCVVTYKKLVIGCAFLVPDVGHNHAYISFVLTRCEWQRANIATFMLYHLLQTCSGQDVTLHVSPTNSAIFLYQKFGFKVEELIQDFYEKYYDIDYKGCRHAVFLRLVR